MEASDHSAAADDVVREAGELPPGTAPFSTPVPAQNASFAEQVLDQLSEIGVRTAHIEGHTEALVSTMERIVCLCVEREVAALGRSMTAHIDRRFNELEALIKGMAR